jgi:hypothetical protein
MTGAFTKSVVEQAGLVWLESLGWSVTQSIARSSDIAPVNFATGSVLEVAI